MVMIASFLSLGQAHEANKINKKKNHDGFLLMPCNVAQTHGQSIPNICHQPFNFGFSGCGIEGPLSSTVLRERNGEGVVVDSD